MFLLKYLQKCCAPEQSITPSKKKQSIRKSTLEIPTNNQFQTFTNHEATFKADKYEGEELNGKPHGNGIMFYANGDFYRGEWVCGIKEGRGLQMYQELGIKYEGEWQKDKPYGNGKLTSNSESSYVGEFKDGLKHGKGHFEDMENKKTFLETYSHGKLTEQLQINCEKSKEEDFPTLVLDKERFNSKDLNNFEDRNPEIAEFDIENMLKYYSLCKLMKKQFIGKHLRDWSIKDVLDFLQEINLKRHREIFYKNKIKGKDLITLTEKELKDDLKLKIGDRKRFLAFVQYLIEIHETNSNFTNSRRDRKGNLIKDNKKHSKYTLRSISSMKKILKSINSNYSSSHRANPIYQQSIEELNQSSESEKQHKKSYKKDFITEDLQNDDYSSNTFENHHSLNNNKNSFEEDLEKVKSAGSSSKGSNKSKKNESNLIIQQMMRKKSEDNNSLNAIINPSKMTHKQSEHYHKVIADHNLKSDADLVDSSSSNSSSENADMELLRKRTTGSQHQHMEIRELYEFLKEHRSLDFLIKQKDIEILEQIGEGGYGKVYKAKYIGSLIAVKDYMKTGKHRNRDDFMKEVEVMSDLKHPNIVLYMGMCITANKYILITEYLENGSLFDQLHKKKKKFGPTEQIEIINDIVLGMVYLHSMKNILHRDLKSSNVLIGEDWKVKLCDFGLSGQRKKSKKKSKNRIGTYQWMAPEVIRNQQMDFFSDVYSFGVIIWELLSEKIPYEGLTEQQIIGIVGYDQTHELEEPAGNQFLVQIMNQCLRRKPSERPTFIQIQEELKAYEQNHQNQNFSS